MWLSRVTVVRAEGHPLDVPGTNYCLGIIQSGQLTVRQYVAVGVKVGVYCRNGCPGFVRQQVEHPADATVFLHLSSPTGAWQLAIVTTCG
jgi:hypothetical protein